MNELTYEGLLMDLQRIKEQQRLRASPCIRLEEDISMRSSEILSKKEVELAHEKEAKLKRLSSIGNNLQASRIDLCSSRKDS